MLGVGSDPLVLGGVELAIKLNFGVFASYA